MLLLRRIIYVTVAMFAIAGVLFEVAVKKSPKLETYKTVPDFQLTERSGKTVSLADLKGKIWIANFFYASCPGPCPAISGRLETLQGEVLHGDDVRLVSISTQPDMDTPEVLREYAQKFHASDKWLFLTGDKAQIYNLSNKGFLLTAGEQNVPGDPPIIHSTKLALVDRAGNIRGYYDGMDEANLKLLADDVKRLLHE